MSERLAVFASGSGTNLQALIDHFAANDAADLALVISDRAECGALERAEQAGIPTHHIPVQTRPIAAVSADTIDALESARIDLVALAGYLRLIPPDVVRRFHYRILNIHPALLPGFGGKGMYGLRVHRAVLDAGCRITGPTVHLVDERYDEGRIVAQWPVPVLDEDTPETLSQRVLRVEHVLYPAAVEWLARVLAAAEGDDAAAVRDAIPMPVSEDVCFRLEEDGEPDRRGVRRIFGLD
ncbi:MAG: phosphoribosylglycinamide formyltransferase [Longimicrobiales bacterium]|nr:phosphoribosylglycinamide formyltransferase [Longimicrobiales bacterium]